MVFMFIVMSMLSWLSLSNLFYGVFWMSLSQNLEISVIGDKFSFWFMSVLLLVASSVLLWSHFYMSSEYHYRRFLLLVLMFLLSMIFLVYSSSLVLSIIGWDGLGATSFLLVIYYSNRKSLSSGMLTALTNRVGDILYLVSIPLLITNNMSLIANMIFIMLCMTKSAQFPFSSWLPAAMAAPTPVSALVHSSTLVTAGIYMLIRYNFCSSSILVGVGSLTMIMAGICACAESDLKKIVALSTLSQLGIMVIALGIHMKMLSFYHLLCHAMFKSLMFLCVGMIIHGVYGSQESRAMNISNNLLWPSVMMSVASASLCGFPFLAGFFSKDQIVESFYFGYSFFYYSVVLIGIGLTTSYSMKALNISLLSNTTSCVSTMTTLMPGFQVKAPLSVLGIMAVSSGFLLNPLVMAPPIQMLTIDFFQPVVFIIIGLSMGWFISFIKYPNLWTSLFFLTPNFQYLSCSLMKSEIPLKEIDNGIIEWVGPRGFLSVGLSLDKLWGFMIPFLYGIFCLLLLLYLI